MIQCEKILGNTDRSFETKSLYLSKLLKCHKFKEAFSLALGEQHYFNCWVLCAKCTSYLNHEYEFKSLLKEQLNIYMKALEYSRVSFLLSSFVKSDGLWPLSSVLYHTEKCSKIALRLGQVNVAEEIYFVYCQCCAIVGNTRDRRNTMLKMARLRSWSWNNSVAIEKYEELIRLSTNESAGRFLDLETICLIMEKLLMKNRLLLVLICLIASWYSNIFRLLTFLVLGVLSIGNFFGYVETILRNLFNENLDESWFMLFLMTSGIFLISIIPADMTLLSLIPKPVRTYYELG